jgi:quinone-modifying oxidoreductase subunit QmoB
MTGSIRTYICTGCGIGECTDVRKLAEISSNELGVDSEVHPPLCVPEGVEFLRKDIEAAGAGRAVIVACSSRVNWDVFSPDSLGVDMVERVNIREQVAWSKPPSTPETQLLAEDYLRMGVVRAQKSEPPQGKAEPTERSLLVVGGGVSGLTAALEAADAGSDVVLVEKAAALGGWLGRFHKMFPTLPPYRDLEAVDVREKASLVQDHPRIKVLTSAQLERISGKPGAFDVAILQNGDAVPLSVGSIVLATGWEPYDASGVEYLGFGKYPNVVNSLAMEEQAGNGAITRPSDGKKAQTVAFIQRVGSKSGDPFSYRSSVSDLVALKQAEYVRELNPDAVSYIIYDHMITPGQAELFYRKVQEEDRILFTKGDVAMVSEDAEGNLLVDLENTLIGGNVRLQVDLVVLATGMAPATAGQEILHLEYKQGPDLPVTKHGFAGSNYICFPYETRRTGIYAAGCVREPMDAMASAEDATGAALKAIQSMELISQGAAVHPRVRDLSLPITRMQGCTKCGRCSEECPFGAIEVDQQEYPQLNASRCRRCGICMGACPAKVISFEDYSVEQLSSMVRAVQFPEDDATSRIIAFACENDAYPALDIAGLNRLEFDASVRIIPLRCLGSLSMVLVTDALSSGIDGVMMLGCKTGDDYQCHFIHGSELATKRMENIQETLTRLMLEPERVKMVELEISDYDRVPGVINEFAEEMRAIGPNPYKGF